MKKILLLLLLVLVLTGCKSKEERAIHLIEQFSSQLDYGELALKNIQYKVIETNPAFNSPINNQSCWLYAIDCVEMEKSYNNNWPYSRSILKDVANEPVYNLKKQIETLQQRNEQIGYEFYIEGKGELFNGNYDNFELRIVTNNDIDSLILLELLNNPKYERAREYIFNIDNNNIENYLISK